MDMDKNWQKALMPTEGTIRQAIFNLNETALQIIVVVSKEGFFQGSVTDGDIRRGLLRGVTHDCKLNEVMNKKPLIVPPMMGREAVLHIMEANRLQQVPVVDKDRRVVGLHLWNELAKETERPNLMVLMAGGLGNRLRPATETCPKPMLPVDGKPMLEHIIERAKRDGFRHFVLAVRYLGHMIEDYFGDGKLWGVNIEYLREEEPLGTAGALSLLNDTLDMPLIVSNSDVLTDIKYGELLDFHTQQEAMATMAVQLHELQHPFGVVEVNGLDIVDFKEKPIYRTNVNTGIYAINSSVLRLISKREYCDMPTLFERLIQHGKRTIVYPMHESWLDVGRRDDYEKALRTVTSIN
jgi:dTDP-glucose pyrophosphorylase